MGKKSTVEILPTKYESGKWYWVCQGEGIFTPVYVISDELVRIEGEDFCRKEFDKERLSLHEAVMPDIPDLPSLDS